jgi:hypothetical protein
LFDPRISQETEGTVRITDKMADKSLHPMEPLGNPIRRGFCVKQERDANERAATRDTKAAAAEFIRRDGTGLEIYPSDCDG